MIQFHIEAPDKGLEAALQDKIDNLTKPKGSLGTLEALSLIHISEPTRPY